MVSLGVTTRADGAVVFTADHEGAELPLFWRSILAEDDARERIRPGRIGRDVRADALARRASCGRIARWPDERGLSGWIDESVDRHPLSALTGV